LFTSALHPLHHCGKSPVHIKQEAAWAWLDIFEKRKSVSLLPESKPWILQLEV
jgi:hypothetical protein